MRNLKGLGIMFRQRRHNEFKGLRSGANRILVLLLQGCVLLRQLHHLYEPVSSYLKWTYY